MKKWVHNKSRLLWNRLEVLSIELGITLVIFFASGYLLVFLIRTVFIARAPGIDNVVFNFFAGFTSPGLTRFMNSLTILGSHYFLVPANLLIAAVTWFIRRDKWFALKILSVALSSLIIMFSLKILFSRTRPLMPLLGPVAGYSFPSGHAFMSFTFFGMLIYLVHKTVNLRRIRIILFAVLLLIIFLIGASRIYLRVHYATDVMAGISLGIMWLVISLWVLHMIEKNKTRLPAVE